MENITSIIETGIFAPLMTAENETQETVSINSPMLNIKREFGKLYQRYYRQIYNLCFQVTKNRETSESLTVTIFVQFYDELKRPNAKSETSARIRSLAVTNLLNYLSQTQKPGN